MRNDDAVIQAIVDKKDCLTFMMTLYRIVQPASSPQKAQAGQPRGYRPYSFTCDMAAASLSFFHTESNSSMAIGH